MDKYINEIIEKISKIKCPICSAKVDVIITGETTYQTHSCAHKECNDLINSIEESLLNRFKLSVNNTRNIKIDRTNGIGKL